MDDFVVFQFVFLVKRSAAQFTLEFQSIALCVKQFYMPHQGFLPGIMLVAGDAMKRLLVGMAPDVLYQLTVVHKTLAAVTTAQRKVICVIFRVTLEE